jgi:hypothetical protein
MAGDHQIPMAVERGTKSEETFYLIAVCKELDGPLKGRYPSRARMDVDSPGKIADNERNLRSEYL